MTGLIDTFFNLQVMLQYLPKVLEGMGVTIVLALAVVASGLALGLALGVLRSLQIRVLNALIVLFADVFRAVPPLVILIIIYFALPTVGVRFSGFASAWIGLSLVLAAFAEEIVWAGILSVPRGQWEAARSSGLSFSQALRLVVLPQAVRLTVAPLTSRAIVITKNTALASVVAVGEILYQAQAGYSFSYNPSPLTLGAIAYLILFVPLVWLGRWVETRFAWKR
ncbi:MAG: amino acid ABC transporter permease [Burkholderiaceae bacterium]|jgi:polar amino acid transport system permease protein|nr:amino acid ABC transporter permease [Betaproteobacteria bacterium]